MELNTLQRSAKILFLGSVTRLWAWGRVTQPRKSILADLCTIAVHKLQILGHILTDGAAERADTNKVFDNMPQHQTAASRPLKLYL